MKSTISAVINFHTEGLLAHPSIRSFALCCRTAADAGHSIERVAVLDRPDARMRDVISHHRENFDRVEVVDCGDLGQSRNHAARVATGDYVALFDGDDLWGAAWLARAAAFCDELSDTSSVVCHPEYMYWFTPKDFANQARTSQPTACSSSFLKFVDSDARAFDKRAILFANLYTSNSFARKGLYQQFPFPAVDRSRGFGVEDWAWNAETLAKGIRHAVVPGTVHLIRHKRESSLSDQNVRSGLLPPLHLYAGSLLV